MAVAAAFKMMEYILGGESGLIIRRKMGLWATGRGGFPYGQEETKLGLGFISLGWEVCELSSSKVIQVVWILLALPLGCFPLLWLESSLRAGRRTLGTF